MTLPNRPLTNLDLIKFIRKTKIPHFRGVFMRDDLPKKPWKRECGIVNLDISSGSGTHWTAYYKTVNEHGKSCVEYFDSYGNLKPPIEIINYLGNRINYNHTGYQTYNTVNCGHLCLEFLCKKYLI